MKTILDYNEFIKIAGLDSMISKDELDEQAKEFKDSGDEYTVFSLCDDQDEDPSYILKGTGWENTVGYYILPGQYKLFEECIEVTDKLTVRLSGIAYESLVNGPKCRRVFFAQGCNHNCKGCFNPDTHSFTGGEDFDIEKLAADLKDNTMIKGVTFSGGDPFYQAGRFAELAKEIKKVRPDINIWCYTGFTIDKLKFFINGLENSYVKELLLNIDIVIDGKFVEESKDCNIKYRGSSNQKIYEVIKTNHNIYFSDVTDEYDSI